MATNCYPILAGQSKLITKAHGTVNQYLAYIRSTADVVLYITIGTGA